MHPEEQLAWLGWWSAATFALVCFTLVLRRRAQLPERPKGLRGLTRPALALLILMLIASTAVTLPLIAIRRIHAVDASLLDSVAISLNWNWSRLLAAWMLLGAAIFAACFVIGDPARGRRRCPRCWYEVGPGAITSCPECGRSLPNERRMSRTRRPRRLLLSAVALAIAAAPVWLTPDLRRGTWPRHLSTPTLIAATALWPDQTNLSRYFGQWAHRVAARSPDVCELPPGRERRRLAKHLMTVVSLDAAKYPEHVSSAAIAMVAMGEDALVAAERLMELTDDPPTLEIAYVVFTAQVTNPCLAKHVLPLYAQKNPNYGMVGAILHAWPGRFEAPHPLIVLARAEPREKRFDALNTLRYARPSPDLLEAVASGLDDPNEEIRAAALEALCHIEPDSPASIQARTDALADPSNSVRSTAARLIGTFGPFDPEFIEPLLDGPRLIAGAVTRMLGQSNAPLEVKLDLISRALDREALLADAISACYNLRADTYPLRQQLTRIAAEADARGDSKRARIVQKFLSEVY